MTDDERPRLGDMVVERALASREHVDLCLRHQCTLRASTQLQDRLLGQILIEKGLLTSEQLDALLTEQRGEPPEAPPPAEPAPDVASAIQEQIEAAEQEALEPARPPGLLARLGPVALLAVGGVAVVAVVAVLAWPAPPAQRVLVAYLRSCRESSRRPADGLAVERLGIVVRRFRIEKLLPTVCYDYSPQLDSPHLRQDQESWLDLLQSFDMAAGKRQALSFAAKLIPQALVPQKIHSLVVIVQPIRCFAFLKLPGARLFTKGTYDFLVVRVEAPRWTSGWRVAAYERAAARPRR